MDKPSSGSSSTSQRTRDEIPERFKWNLSHIFPDWEAWERAYDELDHKISEFAALKGTLKDGPDNLLAALKLADEVGQLEYKVWFFASLKHDEDQRDNAIGGRRQQVQILVSKGSQAMAWFNPEVLSIPLDQVREWIDASPNLAVYRFAIEELYRQQGHVLDDKGEHLLSLSSQLSTAPGDIYSALSTADMKYPVVSLSTGDVTVTHGQYRAILVTNRNQEDRATAYRALYGLYAANINTYASLYNAVIQREWFHAQARGYASTLDAALYGNDIPTAVVTNLIETTKASTEPLRRYHRLRKRELGLATYNVYDTAIPLQEYDRKYAYEDVLAWLPASFKRLGPEYAKLLGQALSGGWIDVYENPGKRSGAYSAPVYGVHPYMLLNHNDTLDAAFTVAHEVGHSMHTQLSHAHQPFVYAGYTIFVAEVPSTLAEALFLEYMLAHATDKRERSVLLQHAIDSIVSTFYTQVMFADFELQAHQLVETGKPVTHEVLGDIYMGLLQAYHGDTHTFDELARVTWARIPHFYNSPYYVYQYATCFASSAQLMKQLSGGGEAESKAALGTYLTLLKSGGSDHPMTLLQRAGVDLSKPETILAVVDQLDVLVTQLENEI
jgi:oligoendopeptidase F